LKYPVRIQESDLLQMGGLPGRCQVPLFFFFFFFFFFSRRAGAGEWPG
jgi:hypothetical protein